MSNEFSETVDKIVENYLSRFNLRLKSFPKQDRDELVKEIHSHIYESFSNDPTENEVERIFNVLDKLGEPDDVIAFSLVLAGWLGAIISVIKIINPYFLDSYIEWTPLVSDPTLNGVITLSVSLIIMVMGILLFWFGRYIMRGFKFLVALPFEKIKEIKRKRRLNGISRRKEARHA